MKVRSLTHPAGYFAPRELAVELLWCLDRFVVEMGLAMGFWVSIISFCTAQVLFGVLLTLGVQRLGSNVLSPWWYARLQALRARAIIAPHVAERDKWLNSPDPREVLRWKAYYVARDIEEYGEMTDDVELRLFGRLFCEANLLINRKLQTPRERLNKLRDSLEFVAPYLHERWWRNKVYDQVANWKGSVEAQRVRDTRLN